MNTIKTRVHRPTIVGAVLALFFSLVFLAAPAQAATLSFDSTSTHIQEGQSVTLSWTAGDTTQVEATGAWSGDKAEVGSEVVTPSTTSDYTLIAHDFNGRDVTQTIHVIVDAALPEVTPDDVTFPGDCTVVVPETAGVIYSVTVDGDTEVVDAGTYDGTEFDGDSAAVFTAAADDEHVLAADATTTWSYTPGDECFSQGNDEVVTTTISCSAVTFTNITESTIIVAYGSFDNQHEDGDVTIAAGGSKKVATSRSTLDFDAYTADFQLDQYDSLSVPQNCGENVSDPTPSVTWPIKHPTAAPAAGVTGEGNGPATPFLVLLGIATLIAVRRAYSLGR